MSKEIIVIVDMQNDFITGVLGSKEAEKAVQNAIKYIENIKDPENKFVIFTRDRHLNDPDKYAPQYLYENTNEGKNLPIPHCIKYTDGWCIHSGLYEAVKKKFEKYDDNWDCVDKDSFMAGDALTNAVENIIYHQFDCKIQDPKYDMANMGITIFGLCTDICVISNALLLKRLIQCECTMYYKTEFGDITCIADCCAGSTPEKHEAALSVMESCHIKVVR